MHRRSPTRVQDLDGTRCEFPVRRSRNCASPQPGVRAHGGARTHRPRPPRGPLGLADGCRRRPRPGRYGARPDRVDQGGRRPRQRKPATGRPGDATSTLRSATRWSQISLRSPAPGAKRPRTIEPMRPRTAEPPEPTAAQPRETADGHATQGANLQADRALCVLAPMRLRTRFGRQLSRIGLQLADPRARGGRLVVSGVDPTRVIRQRPPRRAPRAQAL
jgi:hypothetical protein